MSEILQPENHEEALSDIIDPEVPDTPEGKRKLLERCIAAKVCGFTVQVTAKHVGGEGVWLLQHQKLRSPQY